MIYTIQNIEDPLATYIKDDPVRPHIPADLRFGQNKRVIALQADDGVVLAIVCAKLCKGVPSTEAELLADCSNEPDTAVFYTIWSYKAGKGRDLLIQAVKGIQEQYPSVNRFVTLSPKTEMARRFHLKNGAIIFRENIESINYEYTKTGE